MNQIDPMCNVNPKSSPDVQRQSHVLAHSAASIPNRYPMCNVNSMSYPMCNVDSMSYATVKHQFQVVTPCATSIQALVHCAAPIPSQAHCAAPTLSRYPTVQHQFEVVTQCSPPENSLYRRAHQTKAIATKALKRKNTLNKERIHYPA